MKCIPLENVVEIYNRISGLVPHNKEMIVAKNLVMMVLNEVMDNQIETPTEYEIYRKVQHDFYLEDARNFVADWIAYDQDRDSDDITDEELEGYDYEYLVKEYVDREDCNVAYNDTWESVVDDYMTGM